SGAFDPAATLAAFAVAAACDPAGAWPAAAPLVAAGRLAWPDVACPTAPPATAAWPGPADPVAVSCPGAPVDPGASAAVPPAPPPVVFSARICCRESRFPHPAATSAAHAAATRNHRARTNLTGRSSNRSPSYQLPDAINRR